MIFTARIVSAVLRRKSDLRGTCQSKYPVVNRCFQRPPDIPSRCVKISDIPAHERTRPTRVWLARGRGRCWRRKSVARHRGCRPPTRGARICGWRRRAWLWGRLLWWCREGRTRFWQLLCRRWWHLRSRFRFLCEQRPPIAAVQITPGRAAPSAAAAVGVQGTGRGACKDDVLW